MGEVAGLGKLFPDDNQNPAVRGAEVGEEQPVTVFGHVSSESSHVVFSAPGVCQRNDVVVDQPAPHVAKLAGVPGDDFAVLILFQSLRQCESGQAETVDGAGQNAPSPEPGSLNLQGAFTLTRGSSPVASRPGKLVTNWRPGVERVNASRVPTDIENRKPAAVIRRWALDDPRRRVQQGAVEVQPAVVVMAQLSIIERRARTGVGRGAGRGRRGGGGARERRSRTARGEKSEGRGEKKKEGQPSEDP